MPTKKSLLASLEDTSGAEYKQQFEESEETGYAREGKSSNMFYSGLAHKKLSLRVTEGEWCIEPKIQKIQQYFDVFDDFLAKNSKLRLDGAFRKVVTDLCARVFNLCHKKGQTWINSIVPGEQRGPKRLAVKYVFIAALLNCLKSRFIESGGQFIFELSLNGILKCFEHLEICKGTLAKYIILVRTIAKGQGFEIVEGLDRVGLFSTILNRLLDILETQYQKFDSNEPPEKLRRKMVKAINRFVLLNPDIIGISLGMKPVAHNAFAVFSLCLMSLGIIHIQLPTLLEICQRAEPHLSSSSYFPVNACVRHWKEETISLFRSIKSLQIPTKEGLFFADFAAQERLQEGKKSSSGVPSAPEACRQGASAGLETGNLQDDCTTMVELSRGAEAGLGKRESETQLHQDTELELQLGLDSKQKVNITQLEKANLHLILKVMLKSGTMKLLGIDPENQPLNLNLRLSK